ncbi:MAG: T4 RnlA family RNA ligase [Leadbetterella sp.]
MFKSIDIVELEKLVEQRYINKQKHPYAELYIYNYSQTTQFEKYWNEITLASRGLILDDRGNIRARPFPKFFNFEELESDQIPNENFEVFEKLDGSLGILYWIDDVPFIATRGSFSSDQAKWASDFLHSKYSHLFTRLNPDYTYLFEIIYPENRVVVDYGETTDLILIGIVETGSGKEIDLPKDLGFPLVKKFDGLNDYQQLKNYDASNFEGFVLKYKSGYRLKVKLEEYVRLHKILTNCSTKVIWEWLSENKSFESLLENVPDEFYDWVKIVKTELESKYREIENECKAVYKEFETKKEAAAYILKQQYPAILFKMADKRKYDHIIWKMIQPPYIKAFNKEQK